MPAPSGSATQRWRLGTRDLVALAAVAAVVWLAVRSGEGLPFRSSEPAAPAAAGNVVSTTLAPDRADWKRTGTSAEATDAKGPGNKGGAGQMDEDGPSRPGGSHDDPPPSGGGGGDKAKPLVEATIPGVGTVTVDEPELPTIPGVEAPRLPAVPDTHDLLPETPTLPLP